jgi:hypothetical protein
MSAGRCVTTAAIWISTLEEEVKPIAIDLAEGTGKLRQLDEHERVILARWACKTAHMLHTALHFPLLVISWTCVVTTIVCRYPLRFTVINIQAHNLIALRRLETGAFRDKRLTYGKRAKGYA